MWMRTIPALLQEETGDEVLGILEDKPRLSTAGCAASATSAYC